MVVSTCLALPSRFTNRVVYADFESAIKHAGSDLAVRCGTKVLLNVQPQLTPSSLPSAELLHELALSSLQDRTMKHLFFQGGFR